MLKELRVASNLLPPIPQTPIEESFSWRTWFNNLGTYVQQAQTGNQTWSIIQGGTGASTAAGARANLGLGTMATENSSNVTITGGTLTGVATTGNVALTNTTAATVGAAGTAANLPAKPVGYVIININGTNYKMPYYNV
jgi:hypothetical protein